MILGLIPARGGSRGILKKNIKEFCGKPLIEYAIEVGLQCKFIDEVTVSSDSEEILDSIINLGCWGISRPKTIAQDDTPMMPVIQHAIEMTDDYQRVDAVVLIDPTNPLRTIEDMEGAWKLFNTKDTDCVVSGTVARYNPYFNIVRQGTDGYVHMAMGDGEIGVRQQCPEYYNLDVTVWIYSREAIEQGKRIPPKTRLYLVPPERSASIDNEFDWDVAEYLYRRYQAHKICDMEG